MEKPFVSIIIPTHRPNHFRNALMCAINQTYSNIEIIVSDNSDTNEISELCMLYPQVTYRKNVDRSLASNISEPLRYSKGDFIKYIFDDDLIYPHCIDSMIGWLRCFEAEVADKVGLITSARNLINSETIVYEEIKESYSGLTNLLQGSDVIKRMLILQDNFIGEFSTVLFRRSLINADSNPKSIFTAFREDFRVGLIDVPLYVTLLLKSNMIYIPYSLSAFRKHREGGSDPTTNHSLHEAVSDWLRLIRGATREGVLTPREAILGAQNYLKLSSHYIDIFYEPLVQYEYMAQEFIIEQSLRVQE